MNKRTKDLNATRSVRVAVYERDSWDGTPCCVTCGRPGEHDLAHYVPRSLGGLGIPENLVNLCRTCHMATDQSAARQNMLRQIREYLQRKHFGWNVSDLVYKK